MIHWGWIFLAFFAGAFIATTVVALLAANEED